MAITGTVRLSLDVQATKAAGLATATAPINISKVISFTDGTGANQANQVWSDTRTLTATSEDLDLAGILTDAFGTVITSTAVKLIYVDHTHATAELLVGGAATTGFISPFGAATDKLKVRPGGFLLLVAPDATGYVSTAATSDKLKIDAGANTVVYRIVLFVEV